MCKVAADGTQLPCPDAYGAIIGTAAVCALLEIGLSFMTPKTLKRLFPPIVTGPTVMLIGVSLLQPGLEGWAGGSGPCLSRPETGIFTLCPTIFAPHALPWGSAEYIGLGFSVFITIILCERFGSPIMKSSKIPCLMPAIKNPTNLICSECCCRSSHWLHHCWRNRIL